MAYSTEEKWRDIAEQIHLRFSRIYTKDYYQKQSKWCKLGYQW